VAEEVFGEPFVPPVSDGSGQDRTLLRKATQILQDAGFVIRDGKRLSPKGERITVEFLIDEPTFQPHHLPFIKNLATLGIEATLRIVDPVQFRKRVDDFDFDLTVQRFSFSSTPGDALRTYFTSQVRAGRYWIPHWHKASHWLAYWDMFARPATKPRYGRGIPETWWYDRDKAAKLDRAG
jgi:microcin C transport system substrate-binding protein